MKKVLFVATVVKTHIMEFHVPYLQMFKEQGWETAVAARNDYETSADCIIPFCDDYYDIPFERNPLKPGNVRAYKKLKEIIDSGHYDMIHCHTPVGAMLTRLAARNARKKGTRVIYTAHGFHFYKGAPLLNWLVYYPVEKWLSRYTDTLITINQEDYAAVRKFHAKEVRYVHGVGVDTQKFGATIDRAKKRAELGLQDSDFALLSVGELNSNKNHEVVLCALSELKKRDELKSIEYFLCGGGALQEKLEVLARGLDIAERVHFLGYRNDISEIAAACDVFVFMSKREGLPVALMEAMACGLPCVCSEIRGNTDLIVNGESGSFVQDQPAAIAKAISVLQKDPALRRRLGENACEKVKQFDLRNVRNEMLTIYRFTT